VRKAVWLLILIGVLGFGFLASLLLHPDVLAREARFARCAEDLSAACLADLGAEMGLSGKPPSVHSDAIRTLQLLGRDDIALALAERSIEQGIATDIPGMGGAEAYLAPVRIARAIDQGESPGDAYAKTPGARYLHLSYALKLLREPPFGTGRHTDAVSARQREQIDQTAAFLETLAENLQPGGNNHALEMAMELYLKLDDPVSVRRLFDRIERGDDWHGILPEGIVAVVGVDHALSKCGVNPDCRIYLYRRAALVETSPAAAERMLRFAFEKYRDQGPWPDFTEMEEVIGLALQRGDQSLALALAQELKHLAQTREYVFPSFPHIVAARALLATGGNVEDVRTALDRAEAEMPESDGAVLALGHMGPITWGGGIGADALLAQASLRAQIGDVEHAILLMEGIDDPAYAWGEVLSANLPPDVQDLLLAAASEVLAGGEMLRLRAGQAGPLASATASPAQNVRAKAVAADVLAEVDLSDDLSIWVCHALTFIDEATNPDLKRQALECIGQAALRSRDAGHLLLAAGLWFDFEATAP
jgi:hypothetical protein